MARVPAWFLGFSLVVVAGFAAGQPDLRQPPNASLSSPGPPPPLPPAELERAQQLAAPQLPEPPGPPPAPLGAGALATSADGAVPSTSVDTETRSAAVVSADTDSSANSARGSTGSAETAPPPPPPPRSIVAVVQVLDKITAETLKFEAPIGKPIRFKTLLFTAKVCETRGADDPQPRPSAFLLIDSQPARFVGRAPPAAKRVFSGWMFANAPALHPLEHPIYDAWLVACGLRSPSPA